VLVLRFAATAVLNYGFGVALAWLLPQSEFGAVSVLQNLLLLSGAVVAAGLPWALARAVAHADGPGGTRDADSTFRAALAGNLVLGAVLAMAFVAAQLTLRVIPDSSPALTVAVAATIALLALNAVLGGGLQGSRRFDALGLLQTSETATKVLVGLLAVGLLGMGVGGVAAGFAIGAAVGTACGWWGLRDRLPGPGPLAGRATFAVAVPMGIGTASFALLGTLDVLALSALGRGFGISTAAVAVYQAAAILARAPYFVADSLGDAVFPFMAREKTWAEANDWFVNMFRWVLLGLVPLQLVLLIAPEPVLGVLFPPSYVAAADLVRLITVGTVGLLTAVLLLKALYARGVPAMVARRTPVAVVVELAALVVLVPRFGATGAAIAFAAGSWVAAFLLAAAYAGHHRIRLPAAPAVARYTAACGILVGALAAANAVPAPFGLVAISAGLVVYVPAAMRFGLVRPAEAARARAAAGWLRARLPLAAGRRCLLVLGCALPAAAAVLWNIPRSPDSMFDEMAYTRAAQSIEQRWHFGWTDRAVFVHPPLSFLAQAGWLHLLGRGAAALPDAIAATRLLAGAAAVLNVVLLALLARRLMPQAGPPRRILLTLVVAVLAATDPILLRFCRTALIEPLALLGCLVTLHLALALWKRRWVVYVPVVGLASGLALLTKELTVFPLLTPVLYAILGRDRRRIRVSIAAFGVGACLWLLFPLWAARIGLAGPFFSDKLLSFRRLAGVVQVTGWNRPGSSLLSFLSVTGGDLSQYAISYLFLAGGAVAVVWLVLHRLTDSARWLLAFLLTSYAFGAYIVLLGTLNEHFFVYVVPAALLGTVLVADAVLAARVGATRRRDRPVWTVVLAPMIGLLAVLGLAGASWTRFYAVDSDGLFRIAAFVRTHVPPRSAVNGTGDPDKFAFLLPDYTITDYATGPGAESHGVHLFFLSDKDAEQRNGNTTPELTSWVRAHGTRLAAVPSTTYHGLELWQVPTDRYDPLADTEPVPGGAFVTTDGSRRAGYPVLDGPFGGFATAWAALGGKGVAGPPVTARWTVDGTSRQVFDGAVLAAPAGRPVAAVPIVPTLSDRAPGAYRAAGLPPVTQPPARIRPTDDQVRARLTDPPIAAAYLGTGGPGGGPGAVGRARELLGDPVGPPASLPDGWVRQAFAGAVLERPSSSTSSTEVRFAPLGALAIRAGIVAPPDTAAAPVVPPSPPAEPLPPQPAPIDLFLRYLGGALALWIAVTALMNVRRRRRGRHEGGSGSRGTSGPAGPVSGREPARVREVAV
jgi:O-antigen/teichoic acid export membrane protein/4-amino-4-deoxy-L-arabinose transferase-like glycosyltransferase